MYGIQRIDMVKDCMILAGAGVGGGSLVYANTLYEPLDAFYRDPSWAHITDWKPELAPYYDQAKRMLGVVENPLHTPADEVMKQVADDMGVGHTFHPTPVGVFFGGPDARGGEEVADPFFGGAGPARNACLNCGECMTGCRHNAKNTLVKNYLHLAEQAGAVVHPLTTVTRVRPRAGRRLPRSTRGGPRPSCRGAGPPRSSPPTRSSSRPRRSAPRSCCTSSRARATCPGISDRLGVLTRTNSEAILGALAPDTSVDYTRGVAITSSWHPDEVTHIEPCRYGHGSNAMALLQTVLADDIPGAVARAHVAQGAVGAAAHRLRPLRLPALVRAHHRRARDADPRQLDHHQGREGPLRLADDERAGPRPAQPDLHPDRLRGDAGGWPTSSAGPPAATWGRRSTGR